MLHEGDSGRYRRGVYRTDRHDAAAAIKDRHPTKHIRSVSELCRELSLAFSSRMPHRAVPAYVRQDDDAIVVATQDGER